MKWVLYRLSVCMCENKYIDCMYGTITTTTKYSQLPLQPFASTYTHRHTHTKALT